jgi:protein SCO1/2
MTRGQSLVAISVAGLLCLLGAALGVEWIIGHPRDVRTAPQLPSIGGHFTLTATDGTTVTDGTYRGKILLVYFGYTLCPDICPTTLGGIADALDKLGPNADKIQPLFITVDPRRDTPKVLTDYVKNFGSRIIGLTGTPEQIAAAAKAYRVYYAPYKMPDAPGGYLMDHSATVYVMNPEGRFVASFSPETSADQMAERLTVLIADKS